MKNLLLIGYCHLDDGFLYAAKALEKYNYKIFFFPYLSYVMDNIEERDNILIELIKKEDSKEIGDIGIFTYEDSIKIIRPYHVERKKIITNFYMFIMDNIIKSCKELNSEHLMFV